MSIDYQDSALVFIDVINDFQFEGSEKLIAHTEKILPNMVKLKEFAQDNGIPIIYVNDHYGVWQADLHQIIKHCTNDASKHIIEQLSPTDNDYFLMKPQHSAFFQTPLQSLLREIDKKHLIMSGIAGDICVLFSAKDAYMYGFNMWVPKDCMASEDEDGNEYALYLMHSVMKADISPIS